MGQSVCAAPLGQTAVAAGNTDAVPVIANAPYVSASSTKEQKWDFMMSKMKAHQISVMPLEWLKAKKSDLIDWLEYVFVPDKPAESIK